MRPRDDRATAARLELQRKAPRYVAVDHQDKLTRVPNVEHASRAERLIAKD